MIDLSGKHIFVVGGSRGIGAASARMAAKAGAKVTVNYLRRADAAQELVDEIEQAGGQGFAVQADASDEASLKNAMQSAVERLGELEGVVVSAGVYEGSPVEEMTVEFWDHIMAVNLRSTFLAVKTAVPHFRAQGRGGSIVIYTSTAGQGGSAGFSAYATSKAGQIIFMRSMASELAPLKIRVNCIAPAWTET